MRRKRFGQHFLHDAGVLAKIVAAIDPNPGDRLVEIGPGEGALTRRLLERVERMEAIEIDRDLAARLEGEFPPQRLHLLRQDALECDFSVFGEGLRIVGNLPYNISTPLLFHLAQYAGRVRDMHFMLQREVVERMVAAPSGADYGRLSVSLQARFRMRKLFTVARGAFRPPPKVDSCVVLLEPRDAAAELGIADRATFLRFASAAFRHKRKTLRNNLAPLYGADRVDRLPEAGQRAEALSVAELAAIFTRLSSS